MESIKLTEKERLISASVGRVCGKSVVVGLIAHNSEATLLFLSNKSQKILKTINIYRDFRLSLTQTKHSPPLFTLAFNNSLKISTKSLSELLPLLSAIKFYMDLADSFTSQPNAPPYQPQPYLLPQHRPQSSLSEINPFIQFDQIISNADDATSYQTSIKQKWIQRELRAREELFSSYLGLNVFCTSWNVNGKNPPYLLGNLLEGPSFNEGQVDIFCIGFQELDLTTSAYLVSDTTKEDQWSRSILSALGKTNPNLYIKTASKQLVGMLILIFSKQTLAPFIKEIQTAYLGTGILGLMGNKGGVAIRLRVHDTYLCFVNCHLAADTSMVDRRNMDFVYLCQGLVFPLDLKQYKDFRSYQIENPCVSTIEDTPTYSTLFNQLNQYSTINGSRKVFSLFDTDHLFWMGDLNYRIPIPDTEAKQMLSQGQYGIESLLEFDQFTNEKNQNRCFYGFEEGKIYFQPTYKFDIGTDFYDTSEKKRSPSWCDRILSFKNPLKGNGDWVSLMYYGIKMEYIISDHKPIFAEYKAKARIIDKTKYEAVNDDIIRELDRFENDALPDVKISINVLEFENVKYKIPSSKHFTVENTGQVIAKIKFNAQLDKDVISKQFVHIWPTSAMLLPGDSIKIQITILIDETSSSDIISGKDSIDDILILHVENSCDHFISVLGSFTPTSFGMDLEVLSRLGGNSVRSFTMEAIQKMYKDAVVGADLLGEQKEMDIELNSGVDGVRNNISIPTQLWRIVDFIYRHGLIMDKLFTEKGDTDVMEYLRECIDTGMEIDLSALVEEQTNDDDLEEDLDELSNSMGELSTLDFPTTKDSTPGEPDSEIFLDVDLLLKSTIALVKKEDTNDIFAGALPTKATLPAPISCKGKGKPLVVYSMMTVFKEFLTCLGDSLVPTRFHTKLVNEGYHNYFVAKQMLKDALPLTYRNSFIYVVSFLKECVINNKGNGGLNVEQTAKIFTPILLRNPTIIESNSQFDEKTKYATVSGKQGAVLAANLKLGLGNKDAHAADILNRKRRMFLMQFLENQPNPK